MASDCRVNTTVSGVTSTCVEVCKFKSTVYAIIFAGSFFSVSYRDLIAVVNTIYSL